MNKSATLLAVVLTLPPFAASAAPDDPIKRSVVKIFTTYQKPNYYQPWLMNAQESLTGSGAIIDGRRILTNAHVVSDQTYIQVRRAGEAAKYRARVEFVGHDCELAVLKVDDAEFWKGAKPLPIGELPSQRDSLAAYGFPAGGDELSITEGVVSRIEVTDYTHSGRALLALQTDAAINPGNSGGPVVKDGRLVGVSFQSYAAGGDLENTGYAIPTPVVRRFLKDVVDGRYDTVPYLGVFTSPLENASHRAFLGLSDGDAGIVIDKVEYGAAAWGILQPGDVIEAVDGTPVASDGTFELVDDQRISWGHLIAMRQVGEPVALSLRRAGKPLQAKVKLAPFVSLVDGPIYDQKPSYFIFAGLVFTPLTRNYAQLWEYNEMPTHLKTLTEFGVPTAERRHPVVLAYVLPHDVNAGYHETKSLVVTSVNGLPVRDLPDLVRAFERPLGGSHVIAADDGLHYGARIVLDAEKSAAASAEILTQYGVPADRSDDLKPAASAGAPRPD